MNKVEEYKNDIRNCCGDKVGKQFCENYGCSCIAELLVEIEKRDQRIAALEAENKRLRGEARTVIACFYDNSGGDDLDKAIEALRALLEKEKPCDT